MTVDTLPLAFIPAGEFWAGDDDHLYQCVTPYSYWISRYPITNAAYNQFIAAGGYADASLWGEAHEAGYWRTEGQFKSPSVYDKEWRAHSAETESEFTLPNQPIINITWYECLAFTRWLTRRWQAIGPTHKRYHVRLPSAEEWQHAARGGIQLINPPIIRTITTFNRPKKVLMTHNPEPQRTYPWGDTFDARLANYDETGPDVTSPVGSFPQGAAPTGCEDMSGNVIEWTRSPYKPYPTDRPHQVTSSDTAQITVMGGGFDTMRWFLECGTQNQYAPYEYQDDLGFRIVFSTFEPDRVR